MSHDRPGWTTLRSTQVMLNDRIEPADVIIEGRHILAVADHGDVAGAVDLGNTLISPGFIDIQINGGYGHDFSKHPESMWEVGRNLPSTGVTAFVPTVITGPPEATTAAMDAIAHRPAGHLGAEPLGLHLEGPALSVAFRGAHDPELLSKHLNVETATSPLVLIVTVAPEVVGDEVISAIAESGTIVSIGHTNATYAETNAAIAAGASNATHLFNAMLPIHHREPGPIPALLCEDDVTVSVIADGVHVSSGTLSLIAKTVGPQRLVAITDAVAAMGMPPGLYDVGPLLGYSDGETVRLEDGTLAGSILTMDKAVRYLHNEVGMTLVSAILAATTNPARTLRDRHRGRIASGSHADLALLDESLTVTATITDGHIAYGSIE